MLHMVTVAMAKLRKEIGAAKEKGENFGVRGKKTKKPPMRRAREAWVCSFNNENAANQKLAAVNSFVMLPMHSASRLYVFSPAFFNPLVYWRMSEGLMPARLAMSVTLRNEK